MWETSKKALKTTRHDEKGKLCLEAQAQLSGHCCRLLPSHSGCSCCGSRRLDHDNVVRPLVALPGRTAPGPVALLADIPAALGLALPVAAVVLGLATEDPGVGLDLAAVVALLAALKKRNFFIVA